MADKLSREDLITACKITINQFEDSAMAVEAVLTALEEKSEAEEFRTPKKVVFEIQPDAHSKDIIHVDAYCPCCRSWVSHARRPVFCEVCGQAFDWTKFDAEVQEEANKDK